ncbi:trehalose-phosphatase [Roseivivax marinus]|uniref:trehalose-phosphatase n=1 Tax=Roseivivax marinus TaxID=1379903 RepID=UPI001F04FD37|nr:trehalose-phosphatase [Roseivivax marinus]UMA65716.1 trehalose-phosphatase [Roseivivax marinus]
MTQTPPLPAPRQHAFFLDFDGTLAPIVDDPGGVHMPDDTRDAIRALQARTDRAVAVVTGRALVDLVPHLRGLELPLSGSHGHETWHPGDPPVARSGIAPALEPAEARLRALAARHNLVLERKPGALTVHFRGMPHLEDIVRDAVGQEAERGDDLKALHGNMVAEVVLAAAGKGAAIRGFLDAAPFSGRRPVMIGDDVTDEDGFAAAQERGGFGIKIGAGDTCAHYRLGSVAALAEWLDAVAGSDLTAPPE